MIQTYWIFCVLYWNLGIPIDSAGRSAAVLNTLEQTAPDLLILDVEMPLCGIDLCQVVRNDPRWSELPMLFISACTDAKTVHRVFTAGADDYVNKPPGARTGRSCAKSARADANSA
jgi:DNA-binding response OmpR family regulator